MTDEGRHIVPAASPAVIEPGVPTKRSDSCSQGVLKDGGGRKIQGMPVNLVFWGALWENMRDGTPTNRLVSDVLTERVRTILDGPYSLALRQYGVRRCWLGTVRLWNGSDQPQSPDPYDRHDVLDMLGDLGADNTAMHMVFMPPHTNPAPVGDEEIGGEHSHAPWLAPDGTPGDDLVYGFVAWSDSIDVITARFAHEFNESCTDPDGDGWRVDGGETGCTEIGDMCNQPGVLEGVTVSAYWSKADNACIIPAAVTVRGALYYANAHLHGAGLSSLMNHDPSVRRMVRSL